MIFKKNQHHSSTILHAEVCGLLEVDIKKEQREKEREINTHTEQSLHQFGH